MSSHIRTYVSMHKFVLKTMQGPVTFKKIPVLLNILYMLDSGVQATTV